MKNLAVARYARVSSDQQTQAQTIASQVAALRDRGTADDCVLLPECEFIDEGYSGATLLRPGLERLRDLSASGGIERLYVHSPDRLARKYAYQVLLIDEFQRMGIEVVFLNRELSQSPEDELLLQVQGMVAEYERAKILERSRRGKRHAAQVGNITVLSGAPYGYRYVSKHEGGGNARYDILEDEARVVRQVFTWIGQERLSIGEVCRRLQRAEERTRTGRTQWDRSVVWGILKNPAYKGTAAVGKTRSGPLRPRLRAQRNRPLQPRHAVSEYDMPREDWVFIPVPALIDEARYAAVQEQLAENRRRARQSQRGARYLLQGLLVCKVCGYAYYGKPLSPSARKHRPRAYAYYRCVGTDSYRFGGHRVCANTQIRTDLVEIAVWQEVCQLLKDPQRREREYHRRGHARPRGAKWETPESLRAQISKLQRGMARLIDGYAEGLIEEVEFEPRIKRMKQRVTVLEEQVQQLADEAVQQRELKLLIGQLEEFVTKVQRNLTTADWEMKREIIRALVRRVEIDKQDVTVVFRVGPDLSGQRPEQQSSQHCWGRVLTYSRRLPRRLLLGQLRPALRQLGPLRTRIESPRSDHVHARQRHVLAPAA
jgi:site-specific DNA recombinase